MLSALRRAEPTATLLTSLSRYFSCRRCRHHWQTAVTLKHTDDVERERVTEGLIGPGDVIVCRVNGTSDLYVIGTVAAGSVGELSLSSVTTIVGLSRSVEEGYRNRTPDQRVWLFDGTDSGYARTTAPRSLLYL